MDVYAINKFKDVVSGNSYPGRGIVVGNSCDGTKAVIAYFIMGRSENSRNRVFAERDGSVYTEPFDPSKVEDPSLIIYAAVRQFENKLIVTNGDQTDTIYEGYAAGKGFHEALTARCFEPDAPNLTPRISAVVRFGDGSGRGPGAGAFDYSMSILKSADREGTACNRFGYDYAPLPGVGHFIHTYQCDGNPLPTFQGEPRRIEIPDSIDEFTGEIWGALDPDNKISLYVRYTDLTTGEVESRRINKNKY